MSASRAATANVLGALALVITDQLDAATSPAGGGGSAAAALSALDQFLDKPSVTRLRDVLGLTHSGTVRLLERLDVAGLIARGAGPDGRTRSVRLTSRGRHTARSAARHRAVYLDAVLGALTATEVQALHGLLARMMTEAVNLKDGGAWICRRCDLGACGRSAGNCPAATAAVDKYGLQRGMLPPRPEPEIT